MEAAEQRTQSPVINWERSGVWFGLAFPHSVSCFRALLLKQGATFLPEKYFWEQNWWGWLTDWMQKTITD